MKRLTCWIWLTDSPRRKTPGSKVLDCEVSRALLIYNDLSSANHRHPTSHRRSGRPVCLLHIDSSSLTLANVKLLNSWKSNERERSPVSSVLICNFSDPVKNVSEHAVTISTLYTCILNVSPISITFCITMCTNTIEWITPSMLNMFEHEKKQMKMIRDNSYDFLVLTLLLI